MSSWSVGSRGKKIVSLLTTSKVLPVFSEDEVFLGNLDSSTNNDNNEPNNKNNDAEFIKITQSCVINNNGPLNITYLDSGVDNGKKKINKLKVKNCNDFFCSRYKQLGAGTEER